MILFLECATIKDNVNFYTECQINKLKTDENSLLKQLSQIRAEFKNYSNVEILLQKIKNGENIIIKKVIFDKYLKSHVDLMKLLVKLNQPCKFIYSSLYTNDELINTSTFTIKQQLAVQLVLTRYSISSIYHLAAFNQFGALRTDTIASYNPKFTGLASYNINLQAALRYVKQAYEPLNRLSKVYNSVQKLLTPKTEAIFQMKKQVFEGNKKLIQCNIGYLMVEKLRVLNEYGKCKQIARNIYDKLLDVQIVYKNASSNLKESIIEYLNSAKIFFKGYCLNCLLLENQSKKIKQDYGFVKKQFQNMILQNLQIAEEILKQFEKLKKVQHQGDSYEFALDLYTDIFVKHAQHVKVVYSVNIHQELQLPTFESIWNVIPSYDVIQDL